MLTLISTSAQDETNTLKNCIERGLENNYSLRIVRNKQQIAENNSTWANAGLLPKVDLSAGYNGTLNNNETTAREDGSTTKQNHGKNRQQLKCGRFFDTGKSPENKSSPQHDKHFKESGEDHCVPFGKTGGQILYRDPAEKHGNCKDPEGEKDIGAYQFKDRQDSVNRHGGKGTEKGRGEST